MSIRFIAWALDIEGIQPGPKLVLICLCNRANDDTGEAWPGLKSIKRQTGLSMDSVVRHIKSLTKAGYVEVRHRKRDDGSSASNVYRVLHPHTTTTVVPLYDQRSTHSTVVVPLETSSETSSETNSPNIENIGKVEDAIRDGEGGLAALAKDYTTHIGYLTAPMSDALFNFHTEFPKLTEEWIHEAFKIATENNARNWSYVRAILTRWATSGKQDVAGRSTRREGRNAGRGNAGRRSKPIASGRFDADREIANRTNP